jgi:hypothetical protein
MSPLLAQSGLCRRPKRCPLLGVKRTSMDANPMSAFDPKRTLTALDFHQLNPLQTSTGLRHSMPTVRIGRHVAQLDFQRVSDCSGIRSELVCGKRRPTVWHYANGRGANSCSCYRGGAGILARTVDSHFESLSETAAFKLSPVCQRSSECLLLRNKPTSGRTCIWSRFEMSRSGGF